MESSSNEREREECIYIPLYIASGSVQENGVDGVILDVIQITKDPSAKRTAPPCSTHIRSEDVSRALIQQGGGRG